MSSLRSFLVLFLVALSMTVQAAPVAQATNTADIGNITDIESNSSESHASDGSQSTATGKSEGPKEDGGDALANIIAPVANEDLNGNKVFTSVDTLNDILNNASILSDNDDNAIDVLKGRAQVFEA